MHKYVLFYICEAPEVIKSLNSEFDSSLNKSKITEAAIKPIMRD